MKMCLAINIYKNVDKNDFGFSIILSANDALNLLNIDPDKLENLFENSLWNLRIGSTTSLNMGKIIKIEWNKSYTSYRT